MPLIFVFNTRLTNTQCMFMIKLEKCHICIFLWLLGTGTPYLPPSLQNPTNLNPSRFETTTISIYIQCPIMEYFFILFYFYTSASRVVTRNRIFEFSRCRPPHNFLINWKLLRDQRNFDFLWPPYAPATKKMLDGVKTNESLHQGFCFFISIVTLTCYAFRAYLHP